MSFAQERLWFLEQLKPGSSVYNICRAARLNGPLKIHALETSLNETVERHGILRTNFSVVDGRPVQIMVPERKISIALIELFELSASERDAEVGRLITADSGLPFDLSQGPLLRATLLRLGDNDHIFILTTHHIVSDAWSMGILTREFWTLYDAYANGRPFSRPDLPVQYADYAVWQREWLQGEVLEAQLSYWRKQLDNVPMLNLPTDRTRPAQQSYRGSKQPVTLSESLTAAIHELSRREGVTQFMALLVAFQILLHRYTGQEDVVVGSPIANRNCTEVEGLIGFFVNTLVLRTDLSGEPTFRKLLLRVRDVSLGAYAHQDLPFEKLVQELQPERDLSRNPLFQVLFVLQNAPRPLPQVAGISFERVEIETETSPFDLALFLRERDEKLIGYFEYATDLFDASTIERMTRHFHTLLETIVTNPDQPISTLPLLTEAERHRLLVEWNDTQTDYPTDCCIHELFEAQVERTPDAVAVQFEGKHLTYRELNARANQLTYYLQELGVGPEKLVGVCVTRSLDMVVGLLGILKAGGAYVPLDPAYPRERIAFMLEDAQVSVLVIQERFTEDRRSSSDPRSSILDPRMKVVCLDRDREKIAQHSHENPLSQARSYNLAYVIYTSGSTGQPKGVQIEHRSLVNCLWSMRQQLGLAEKDVLLAITTISFDIAALELFLPLITGTKIILADREDVIEGRRLSEKITDCHVTAMQGTPSTWQLLLDAGWHRNGRLKILCGGEALSRPLAAELTGRGSLWNLYGPTETTIWSTIYRVQAGEKTVPIGRPIANTRTYILDTNLQPVPIGVYGELYVGGAGLARGYLNQPEQTAERFIPNPFSTEPDSRLYRTGDLARYLSNGNIEYHGRLDNQVKIRGYRVELGEIETNLNRHPSISESVVSAYMDEISNAEDPKLTTTLVAYFVPTGQPSPNELRDFLKEKLPEFMLPSVFVPLEKFPLTPNGKVDLQALPSPKGSRPQLSHGFLESRTETEELIAQIWKEVLKLEKIGVHDNFFDLGGHSLLAIRVLARVRDILQKDVPLRSFFEDPTVASLSVEVEKIIGKRKVSLAPMVRIPRKGVFPLSGSQRQLWILDQLLPGSLFLTMPYAYRLNGSLDVESLRKSLQEIVRRHEAFQMVFGERNGRPVQRVGQLPKIELPLVDLRHLPPIEVEKEFVRLSTYDASRPFDLEAGPPFRIQLVRLADEEHMLLVTVHHIVCDHWSMQIFRRELMILYEAFFHGHPSPLPEVSIQFIDFVCWQRDLLRRGLLKAQLAYWKKQLASPSPKLEFQTNRRSRKPLSLRTSTQAIEISRPTLTELKAIASGENSTLFIVLLAMLNIVLYLNTGQADIRIGTTVANRGLKEAEDVIGHLLNAVILRTQLSPEMTFKQLLKQVRDVLLGAIGNQELPFGRVVRMLRKEKLDRKDTPPFQVMFIYQNRTSQSKEVSGLTFASWDGRLRRADPDVALTTLDLIFDLREASTKLTGTVNYKTDVVDDQVVSEMIQNFYEITKRVVLSSERCISDVLNDRGVKGALELSRSLKGESPV